jgi:hypothetical protein
MKDQVTKKWFKVMMKETLIVTIFLFVSHVALAAGVNHRHYPNKMKPKRFIQTSHTATGRDVVLNFKSSFQIENFKVIKVRGLKQLGVREHDQLFVEEIRPNDNVQMSVKLKPFEGQVRLVVDAEFYVKGKKQIRIFAFSIGELSKKQKEKRYQNVKKFKMKKTPNGLSVGHDPLNGRGVHIRNIKLPQ